jgi:hypothetical protein
MGLKFVQNILKFLVMENQAYDARNMNVCIIFRMRQYWGSMMGQYLEAGFRHDWGSTSLHYSHTYCAPPPFWRSVWA